MRLVNILAFRWMMAFALVAAADGVRADGLFYDEDEDGDLSNFHSFPTQLAFSNGVNSVRAITGFSREQDFEYFTIELPAGSKLTNILMTDYQGTNRLIFLGMQSGQTFTFPPDEAFSHVGDLLGWVHFGLDFNLGDDILPAIGAGPNAIGFTPPLTETYYTFWIQQFDEDTLYQLDFVVVPEPATAILFCLGVATTAAFVRPRRG